MKSVSTKKLEALEKQLYPLFDEAFGLKDWLFYGEMKDGNLIVAITGRESKHAKGKRKRSKQTFNERRQADREESKSEIQTREPKDEGIHIRSSHEEESSGA